MSSSIDGGNDFQDFKFILRRDAVWQVRDDHEKVIVESIEHDSDRAAAIVAASMIEARLDQAMLAIFQSDKMIQKRTFQPSGPLGSFGTKIDMAFLLHLISKEAHAELTILKTIRNSFAHDLTIRDFDSTSIKDRVRSLRLIDKYLSEDSGAAGSTVMHFGHPLKTPFLFIGSFNKNKNIPRYRHMLTVQMFLAAFARVFVGQRTPPVI